MKQKKRLDLFIGQQHVALSRSYIQSLIMQGKVSINGVVNSKSGFLVTDVDQIEIKWPIVTYVSRAGLKLEKALRYFEINVQDLVALDAGISTGGFSDCLLQHGAQRIYGVDVGYGQLHEKLRIDPRVILIERTNLRYLDSLPEQVDLVTLDLSFISVLKVIDTVKRFLKPSGTLIILIKPQFEARKEQVGRGGIIRDAQVHQEAIERVVSGVQDQGLLCQGITESPITGTDGNKEFLAFFLYKKGVGQ